MQRLDSFDSVPTDSRLKELYFPLEDTTFEELKQLSELGFELRIAGGSVHLEYNEEATCNLIAEELDYISDEEIDDFIEFKDVKFFTSWKQDWIKPYVNEERTLQEIIDDIKTDWILTDEEKKTLNQQRGEEYNNDPKNFPELN